MSFVIKDDDALNKYNEIWDKIKEILNLKFRSMSAYDEKYVKAKVREFNGAIKTNFSGVKIPKQSMHYTGTACRTIDSVMRMEKKSHPQLYLEKYKHRTKKKKMIKFIEAKLESQSESELESGFESDTE